MQEKKWGRSPITLKEKSQRKQYIRGNFKKTPECYCWDMQNEKWGGLIREMKIQGGQRKKMGVVYHMSCAADECGGCHGRRLKRQPCLLMPERRRKKKDQTNSKDYERRRGLRGKKAEST